MEAIFSLPLADDLSFPPTGTAQAPVEPLGETDFSRVLSWAFGEKTEDRTSSGDEVPENLDGFTLAGLQTVSASGAPLYGLQGGENSSGYGLLEREGESMPMAIGDGQGKGAPGVRKDTLPDPFPGEPSMSTGPLAAPPPAFGGGKKEPLPFSTEPRENSGDPSLPPEKGEHTAKTEGFQPIQNSSAGTGTRVREEGLSAEGKPEPPAPRGLSNSSRPAEPDGSGTAEAGKIKPAEVPAPPKGVFALPRDGEGAKGESVGTAGTGEGKSPRESSSATIQESSLVAREARGPRSDPQSSGGKESTPKQGADPFSPKEETRTSGQPAQPSLPVNKDSEILAGARQEARGFPSPAGRDPLHQPAGKEGPGLTANYSPSPSLAVSLPESADPAAGGEGAFPSTRGEPPSVFQQVGERVLWLIRNQEEKIKISLDPPELGHLSLEIHRTGEKIQATLCAENPVTRATLESSQPDIQKIVEAEGFKLERFEVLVQPDMNRQERRETHAHPGFSHSSSSANGKGPATALPDFPSGAPGKMHGGSRYLDLLV